MLKDERVLSFAKMTPALWERMVPQGWQDAYLTAKWRAKVWMRTRGLLPRRTARRG